jgi:hypothetical protein
LWIDLLGLKADALGDAPDATRIRTRADSLRAQVKP